MKIRYINAEEDELKVAFKNDDREIESVVFNRNTDTVDITFSEKEKPSKPIASMCI